ncbi:LysR family transcriptional regulator [Acidimicrobiia bacterium EGI L10123]|uniref:LysR family transcriptional regulator n=1 Tax=Salinilacustrithrix flava TaxID=2957203 RepID=UPI003D7C296C|nr:LysR family transcriptional regulator [Acidimicrobiia bacterium EGI L10123]
MPAFPDLEIRHLAALVAVAEEGSFARAAGALGFTQSAVSQQIASLERAVGLPVLDRPKGPRPAELTPAGRLLLDHARDVLDRIEAVSTELDQMRRGVTGRLVIGTFQSVSAEILPPVVGRMRAEVPQVDIGLFETDDQTALVERVLSDELDLAFTVDAADERLSCQVLGHDPFVVLVAADDPIGAVATPADISDHPLIGQPSSNVCQRLIDQRLDSAGIRADYVFRSLDNGAVQGMVRSGMGRAIMPMLAIDPDDPGIRVLPLDPPLASRTIQLTRRAGRSLPPAADRFVAIAEQVSADRLRPEPAVAI